MEDNLTYLDYLLRRFAAFPFLWWSLANEYDLCRPEKTRDDFEELESYIAANDPYHHLLSCHHCFAPWDFSRPNITHVSYQAKSLYHVPDWYRKFSKPVIVDECCYEGNLPALWGCITGEEMTARFWNAVISGGYCTHGETFLDETNEVIWWAKGGRLIGQSPARIAFLKDFVYSLPGYIEPAEDSMRKLLQTDPEQLRAMLPVLPRDTAAFAAAAASMTEKEKEEFTAGEHIAAGRIDDQVYLYYIDNFCPVQYFIDLPGAHSYRVEVIDTWEMTRATVLTGVNGRVCVPLPGKTHMAIAAFAQ